tara:strand:+ start:427 stop:846 length:420 start_codon:yes stop_codon:yes gene_type:complete
MSKMNDADKDFADTLIFALEGYEHAGIGTGVYTDPARRITDIKVLSGFAIAILGEEGFKRMLKGYIEEELPGEDTYKARRNEIGWGHMEGASSESLRKAEEFAEKEKDDAKKFLEKMTEFGTLGELGFEPTKTKNKKGK